MEIIEDNREPDWDEWDYSEIHGVYQEIQKDVENLVTFIARLYEGSLVNDQKILSYILTIDKQVHAVKKRMEEHVEDAYPTQPQEESKEALYQTCVCCPFCGDSMAIELLDSKDAPAPIPDHETWYCDWCSGSWYVPDKKKDEKSE